MKYKEISIYIIILLALIAPFVGMMRADSAIGFFAISTIALSQNIKYKQYLSILFTVLSISVLIEYILAVDLTGHFYTKMSIPSAICFTISFASLYWKSIFKKIIISSILMGIAGMAVLGHIFGIEAFHTWGKEYGMSLGTSICFVIFSLHKMIYINLSYFNNQAISRKIDHLESEINRLLHQ